MKDSSKRMRLESVIDFKSETYKGIPFDPRNSFEINISK
jgi:hypothetical protein